MNFKKFSVGSILGCVAISFPLILAACSNASSSSDVSTDSAVSGNEDEIETVESVEKMGECNDENVGQMFKVERVNALGETVYEFFTCEDGKWTSDIGGASNETIHPNTIIEGTMTDERDGKTYRTVKIGAQTWMAENLNFDPGQGHINDEAYDWSWCYYDNTENCAQYGRLYTWPAAMDSLGTWSTSGKGCGFSICSPATPVRGVCPSGWHLPSKDEWDFLFRSVGGISNAARVLKAQSGWDGYAGSDSYRFSSLPAGNYGGFFSSKGSDAYFWSSTYTPGTIMRT